MSKAYDLAREIATRLEEEGIDVSAPAGCVMGGCGIDWGISPKGLEILEQAFIKADAEAASRVLALSASIMREARS